MRILIVEAQEVTYGMGWSVRDHFYRWEQTTVLDLVLLTAPRSAPIGHDRNHCRGSYGRIANFKRNRLWYFLQSSADIRKVALNKLSLKVFITMPAEVITRHITTGKTIIIYTDCKQSLTTFKSTKSPVRTKYCRAQLFRTPETHDISEHFLIFCGRCSS